MLRVLVRSHISYCLGDDDEEEEEGEAMLGLRWIGRGTGLIFVLGTVREDDILCLLESEREARRLR